MINKIAIIIVTFNGSKWIEKCLASVFKTTPLHSHPYQGGETGGVSVIVVDNASDDNSADIARNFKDEYGRSVGLIQLKENTGFVGGNNVGIKHAIKFGCDAVILLNQDTEVEPDWLDELVKVADSQDVGIAQAMMLLGNERDLINNIGNAMHYLGFGFVKHYREKANQWLNRVEPLEIGYASGAAMLIKREVLEKISPPACRALSNDWGAGDSGGEGVFDEKFFAYHEDLDLCWRARLAGYKIMLAPKAIVYHYYEFHRNKEMFYWTEKNRWACLLQNYQLGTLLILGPMLFIIELMMILYSTASGWLWYKLKSYVWILKNMPAILSKRREVQKMRCVSDKEVIKHMDSKLEFSEVSNPILKHIVSPIVKLYYKII